MSQEWLEAQFGGVNKQFNDINKHFGLIDQQFKNVFTELKAINTRLSNLEDRVTNLENIKSGKKSKKQLMEMSTKDLEKIRQEALVNEDMDYVLEITKIVNEKMKAFKKLGSWQEVTRYYECKIAGECDDIPSYLELNLPMSFRNIGLRKNPQNDEPKDVKKTFVKKENKPEMKEYGKRQTIDHTGNITFIRNRYIAKLGIKDSYREVYQNPNYTGNVYVRDENNFNVKIQPDDIEKIDKVVKRLYQNKIIAVTKSPKFLSEIMAIRKNDTMRLTLNLLQFNKLCYKYTAKYLSEKQISEKILESNSAGTIDIEDGFFNIDLHYDDQDFICFEWNGIIYKFLKLPQGAINSPYIFDTAMKDTLSNFPNANNYLDDIVITQIDNESQMKPIEDAITSHGFKIGKRKYSSEKISFLGRQYDLKNKTWAKDPDKLAKAKRRITKILTKETEIITKREAYNILSTLTSLFQGYIIPDEIKDKFNEIKDVEWDKKGCHFSKTWTLEMLDKASKPMEIPLLIKGSTPENHIYLDASDFGLGSAIYIKDYSTILSACKISNVNDWKRFHINDREMLALEMAIDTLPDIKKKKFNICTDNPAVVGLLSFKKVQYNSLVFSRVREKILDAKISYSITKMDKKNEDLKMQLVDGLSRGIYPDEDSLEIYTGRINIKDGSIEIENYSDYCPNSSQ